MAQTVVDPMHRVYPRCYYAAVMLQHLTGALPPVLVRYLKDARKSELASDL
jgi:hypothetical protein